MNRRGRFGKYGDVKRKAKIRENRLLKADQREVRLTGGFSRLLERWKPTAPRKGSSPDLES